MSFGGHKVTGQGEAGCQGPFRRFMEFEPNSAEGGSALRLLSLMVSLGWEQFQLGENTVPGS